MIITNDSVKIAAEINSTQLVELICVSTIDKIAPVNDSIVEDTIDTNTSSATRFSTTF